MSDDVRNMSDGALLVYIDSLRYGEADATEALREEARRTGHLGRVGCGTYKITGPISMPPQADA